MPKINFKLFFLSLFVIFVINTISHNLKIQKQKRDLKINNKPIQVVFNDDQQAKIVETSAIIKQTPVTKKQVNKIAQDKPAFNINNFPVLSKNVDFINKDQQFSNERLFRRLNALQEKRLIVKTKKVKTKNNAVVAQVKEKKNENIIRISNNPIATGFLSSQYGIRKDPMHKGLRMHQGIDIAAEYGTAVKPMGKGKVIFAGYKPGYGNIVEIQHGNAVLTRYAHLKQFLVEAGAQVKVNQIIGLVGNSGRSTGPHLHLELLFNGKQVDPQVFLANHFGSSTKRSLIAQTNPNQSSNKQELATLAVKQSYQGGALPVISYQDYVKSVDGLFGFSAPVSFEN